MCPNFHRHIPLTSKYFKEEIFFTGLLYMLLDDFRIFIDVSDLKYRTEEQMKCTLLPVILLVALSSYILFKWLMLLCVSRHTPLLCTNN